MSLTDVCIRRPVLAWVLLLAVVIAGGLGLSRIGIGLLPDLDRPVLTVQVPWPGAPVESVERQVAVPLEETLSQVEGVTRIESQVYRGWLNLTVTFGLDRDADAVLQEAQSRISAAVRRLPRDIDPPSISKANPEDEPILRLAVTGERPLPELADLARTQVIDALLSVPGVGEVVANSGQDRIVRVWLDRERLERLGVGVGEVQRALSRFHREDAAGTIVNASRESALRIYGEAATREQLLALPVAVRSGGAGQVSVALGDVAEVEDGFADSSAVYRVDGVPGIGIEVRKARDANAVAVADAVKARLARIAPSLPSGVEARVVRDFTGFIRDSLAHLLVEIGLAIALTALVCRVALGSWGAAGNVMLAIPMSLLGTVMVLWLCGITLNTFTLLGLALAVGLVVDDSIMVQESIARRLALGDDPVTAARRGTAEIRLAAAASTAAILAVFLPVLAMPGEIGRSFAQFGLALGVAVALSYVEAVTLTPARSAQMLRWRHAGGDGALRAPGWLRALLARPALVLIAALALSGGLMTGFSGLRQEVLPGQDQGFVRVHFNPWPGTPPALIEANAAVVESAIRGHPAAEATFVRYQTDWGFGGMVLRRDRTQTQTEVADEIRAALAGRLVRTDLTVAGANAALGQTGGRGGQRDADVELIGPDWQRVQAAARQLFQLARAATRALINVGRSSADPAPELAIVPDPAACARVGLSVEEVSQTVGAMIGGANAARFTVGDQRIDVRLRLRADQRMTPEQVGAILLRTPAGAMVPVRAVAAIEERVARSSVTRIDRARAAVIWASAAPGSDPVRAQRELERLAAEVAVDGVRQQPGQVAQARAETGWGVWIAFALGLAAAYLILAAQFDSWRDPLTVLAIIPFSVGGAAVALWMVDASLSAISGIGLLLLMGLAKKNSILLVDCANRLRREEGLSLLDAAAGAVARRLRPILMTSVATIAGALPIAIGMGPGAELRQPMAVAVIGGIAVSTALALIAIPALWLLLAPRRARLAAPAAADTAAP